MTTQRETNEVRNPCLLEAATMPDVLAWRQVVGRYRHIQDPDRVISIGQDGQSDACVIVGVEITPEMVGCTVGVACQVEFKTKDGRESADQKRWGHVVKQAGGIYSVIRSVTEFKDFVSKVRQGVFFERKIK